MNNSESTIIYRFGAFELDENRITLKQNGVEVLVPAKPWALLLLLLKNAPNVVNQKDIFSQVWHDRPVTANVLSQIISRLRQILGDSEQNMIKNVHGVGFCYAGTLEVIQVERDTSASDLSINEQTRLPGHESWRLSERLAARGDSQVWLAEHRVSNERHVFKFAIDATGKAELKREIIASRILSEECDGGFVPVLNWQLSRAPYFIELPFVAGENLETWMDGNWPEAQHQAQSKAVEIIRELAKILTRAHQNGIVHGDLSLKNILMHASAGQNAVPLLADFGSAALQANVRMQALEMSLPAADANTGHVSALLYAAPELLRGENPTSASDVYALGVMFFQLLIGDRYCGISPGWEASLSSEILRTDILAMCAANADDRISSNEIYERLANFDQRTQDQQTRQLLAKQSLLLAQSRQKRRRNLTAAAVFAAGSLIAGVGWWKALHYSQELEVSLKRAQDSEARAAKNEQKAVAAKTFFAQSIFVRGAGSAGGHPDIKLIDAVDRAMEDAFASKHLDSDLRAEVILGFLTSYSTMGQLERVDKMIARIEKEPDLAQHPELKKDIDEAIALRFVRHGQLLQARTAYTKLVRRPGSRESERALFNLYLVHIALQFGDYQEMERLLPNIDVTAAETQAVRDNRRSSLLQYQGEIYRSQKRWREAQQAFEELVNLEEKTMAVSTFGLRGLARLEAAQGNSTQAIKMQLEAMKTIQQKAPQIRALTLPKLELAEIYLVANQFDNAIKLLDELLISSQVPTNLRGYNIARAQLRLAQALHGTGRVQDAQSWLAKSAAKLPGLAPPDSKLAMEIQSLGALLSKSK